MINNFTQKYRFLSNYWPCTIDYEGISYPSTEHAYQAAKSLDPTIRLNIARASTPGIAKRYGKYLILRPNWDTVKLEVMEEVLNVKFHQDEFKQMLLATGEEELVEGNYWGDVFWGICNGVGENHLGKLLMKIREEIKVEDAVNS